MRKIISTTCLIIWGINLSVGQDKNTEDSNFLITTDFTNSSLVDIVDHLEGTYNLKFFYKEEWLKEVIIPQYHVTDVSLEKAIQELFKKTALAFQIFDGNYIFLFDSENLASVSNEVIPVPITLTGNVVLANTKAPAPNIAVYIDDLKISTVTNEKGYYTIEIPSGIHTVMFRSLEFLEEKYTLNFSNSNNKLNVNLFEKNRQLEEVIITGGALRENLTSIDVGRIQLNIKTFKKLPTFLGEIDVTRVIKSLPGVQSVGEGSADFNVRGGNRDQNLILLDDIPIYNSSHLLGFFSIFNPDLISDFSLYKGSIPANYGGRLSSVLNVNLKNPNFKDFELDGGLGFVSNRLSVNVPINKKNALRIAGRYSNPTWILKKVKDKDIRRSSALYYDFVFKYKYLLNDKNSFDLSVYNSYDESNFAGSNVGFNYENLGASLKYVHSFSEKTSSLVKFSFIDYKASSLDNQNIELKSIFKMGISNVGAHIDVDHQINENTLINGGFETKYTQYNIGQTLPGDQESGIEESSIPEEQSLESAAFARAEFKLLERLKISAGLRFSIFHNIGSIDEYVFDPNRSKSITSVTDTLRSSSGEFIRSFSGLEPRFSATYLLKEEVSLKFSYARTRQYEYLFSNSTSSLPVDIWKPTDNNIPVQIADQISVGLVTKFKEDMFDLSTDIFYKNVSKTAILEIGSQAIGNELLVSDVINAEGNAYGWEVLFRKVRGDLTGILSYTYSVSRRRIVSELPNLSISNGDFFRSDFDSPHNLSLSANFKTSKILTFSANFVFNSGRPVTIPTSSFVSDNLRVFSITERNNFRIPNTHRLDLSMTIEGGYKKNKRWESSWTVSIYNVYGQKNPFSVFLRAENNTSPRLFKLSILGTAFPSVTYNLKLNPKTNN